jgi:hypothetical protein
MLTGANGATFRWSTGFALAALVTTSPLSAPPEHGSDGASTCDDQSAGGRGCALPVDLVRERQLRQLERHLSERMKGLDPALHEDLALVILEECEAARLDARLVLAVIEVESGYDPSAVSPIGALGLMQVLPSTQRREIAWRPGQADERTDPIVNVRAGIRYLRRCLDSYPDLDVALMAYNAGPNRLYAWLQVGAVPGEVRGYARRVLDGQERLRRQLPAEDSLGAGAPAAARPKAAGLSARAG